MALEITVWPVGAVDRLNAMAHALVSVSGQWGDVEVAQLHQLARVDVLQGFTDAEIASCTAEATEGIERFELSSRRRAAAPHPRSGTDHERCDEQRRQANELGGSGQYAAAAGAFARLVEERISVFDSDDPESLTYRYELAYWRSENGDHAIAAAELALIEAAMTRTLGPRAPATLRARHLRINQRAENGEVSYADAADALSTVLTEQISVLGPEHPDSLAARSDLAFWRHAAAGTETTSHTVAARAQVPTPGMDRSRIDEFGGARPGSDSGVDTAAEAGLAGTTVGLASRRLAAKQWGDAGQYRRAVDELASLIRDLRQHAGPDDPDVLECRYELATWQAAIGDGALASTELSQLRQDMVRVLGRLHPATLRTRALLINQRAEYAEISATDAMNWIDEVYRDQVATLGPESADTLASAHDRAFWRGEAGDPDAAVVEFSALLDRQAHVLGPRHPDTLTTRVNLARWRGEAGDAAAAVAELEELLRDRADVLGNDHPRTFSTRHDLAYWRAEAGLMDLAQVDLEVLLRDQYRVLGKDHPDTLNTRYDRARLLGVGGNAAAAVARMERLLTDQTRVLGASHPNTEITRGDLSHWRRVAASERR